MSAYLHDHHAEPGLPTSYEMAALMRRGPHTVSIRRVRDGVLLAHFARTPIGRANARRLMRVLGGKLELIDTTTRVYLGARAGDYRHNQSYTNARVEWRIEAVEE